jgi:outer membrane protein OmpA-like peptidoglycan-associated protein/uncharacterized surface protein with fasciclin (FAS1) repeats
MPSSSRPVSRYQRRILAWGGGVACLLYVVGAPIYLDRVEGDLTERVTAELEAAGHTGVRVSFSGQTGSISCAGPLGDPRGALELAYDVRGVRSIDDLPDECRVRTDADGSDTATNDAPDGATDDGAGATAPAAGELPDGASTLVADTDADSEAASTTSTLAADFETVYAVLDGNPQFSLLRQLVEDADLVGSLTGPGPLTLFAPTDAAFDALPADAVAQLRSDPDLLVRVLGHHLVEAELLVADLAAGALTTVAGDQAEITVDPTADGGDATLPRIDAATIVEPDVRARNGVVHAIDALLLPADVDLSVPERLAPMTATFGDGSFTLDGVVRSEVERTILRVAATTAVGEGAVTDQLVVDPDLGLDEATAQDLATLIPVVAASLVSGTAGFDGEALVVTGTTRDEAGRAAVEQAGAAVDAAVTLTEPPPATEVDATDLEAELNAFVAANPVLFEPSSSVLDESALPVLDEIARRAQAFTGVTITVEGHTDSDGDDQENLVLSTLRAAAVQQALVARGLAPDAVSAEGFGSTRPVMVDGVEDKAASRRVEFRVVVA